MQIRIGYLNKTSEGGAKAQVTTLQDEVIDDVLLLYPYGFSSNIQNDENSSILLFSSMGSDTNIFGIPYNPPLQPSLESQETATGNFKTGNKVTYKANGDIEVSGTNDFLAETLDNLNVTAATKIILAAPEVELGDAVDLVLNNSATMQVTVSSGSSAGTYPVTIVSPGQTKVKA